MTATESRITRARSAIGVGCRYKLGLGGFHPADPWPARRSIRLKKPKGKKIPVLALARWCDCSGFISWLLGRNRKTTVVPGMWGCSTDSIYRDTVTHGRVFQRIGNPIAGCLAVYPDHAGEQGHVALVVDVVARTIIDCSGSQDGVTEHDGGYFWRNPATVWCVPMSDAG